MGVKVADLRTVISTRARTVYPYRINFESVGYEALPKMKEWCETNCKGICIDTSYVTQGFYHKCFLTPIVAL